MNSRRSFLKHLGIAAAAFSILPSAISYWKPKTIVSLNPILCFDFIDTGEAKRQLSQIMAILASHYPK